MTKIDVENVPVVKGSPYPAPHDIPCRTRENKRLALAAGLTQFGVNLTTLKPGAWSSQRHWHTHEDEFIYVLEGEVVLVTDAGEAMFRAGDCAGFKGGVADGHHLQNRSSLDAVILTVGSQINEDGCDYPDIDMKLRPGRYTDGARYTTKDGTPYA